LTLIPQHIGGYFDPYVRQSAVATPQRLGGPNYPHLVETVDKPLSAESSGSSAEYRDHCGARMKTDPYLQLADWGQRDNRERSAARRVAMARNGA
jgi:hypothetical protein